MNARRPRLSALVALAYIAMIVYASLRPFEGWRMPPEEIIGFLAAPWPRYVTASDIALNIAAYLPLGAILFVALRPPLSAAAAALAATLVGTTLSLGLESAQMFLPTRIASNIDLLANSAGACVGALAAWSLLLPAPGSSPLAAARQRVFRAGTLGDCGLLLIALWVAIQLHPAALVFGNGDVRDALQLMPCFPHTPQAYLLVEAAVAALAIVAAGLLLSLLLPPEQRPLLPVLAMLLLALGARTLAAATLVRSVHWLQWLTPGTGLGLVAGMAALALIVRLPRVGRTAVAVLCIVAGVVAVNAAPANPYQTLPPFMLNPHLAHLTNFGYIMRLLSWLWPLLAIAYLIVLEKTVRGGDTR